MTTKLSPEVLEQLKLEAQNNEQAKINYHGSDLQRTAFRRGYLAGSIAEREKAMELVARAEELIIKNPVYSSQMAMGVWKALVEKYLGKAKE